MITRTIGSFVVIMLYLDFLDRFELEETNSFPASRVSNSINEDIESMVVALQKNIFYASIFRGEISACSKRSLFHHSPSSKHNFSVNVLCGLPRFATWWPFILFKFVTGFHTN
jgi:hypothetical protein